MKVKYPLPTSERYAFMQWCDIPRRSNKEIVYLRRLRVIQTPAFGVMVHWIEDIDDGPYPHDHPWTWFRTFVVRGGYTEIFFKRFSSFVNDAGCTYTWKRWSTHKVNHYSGHQITDVSPGTITLVFHGKRIRRFCFWTKDRGKVPYNQIRPEEFNDVG